MPKIRGNKILIESLKLHGVKVIFGIPGFHNLPIYDVLYDERAIQTIVATHECGAAFMADGFARATGEPGVCLTTGGPGVTNAATGLGESYSDSIPILLISGDVRSEAIGKEIGAYHEMDLLAFTRPLTKWNAMALHVEEIPFLVNKAFYFLKTGNPRPVHLTFPTDILRVEGEFTPINPFPYERSLIEEKLIDRAFEKILTSKRPLILAGGGTIAANATEELSRLVATLEAPTLFTRMGKGAISEDNAFCFGYSRTNFAAKLVAESDCMIALGVRFTDLSRETWQTSPRGLIHVNINPLEIGKVYHPEIPVVGDVKSFLIEILKRLSSNKPKIDQKWKESILVAKNEVQSQMALKPRNVFDARDLREVLPRDAIISVDVCVPGYAMFSEFKVYEPRTYLTPTLFIAMGYGLPAAIGAKVAFPERIVVSVSGDGGFLMTCTELATARKYDLGIIAIVINDHCYNSIKMMQDTDYNGRHIGVDLQPVDFLKLAESFDIPGSRVTKLGELKLVLEKALEAGGPHLIEVLI